MVIQVREIPVIGFQSFQWMTPARFHHWAGSSLVPYHISLITERRQINKTKKIIQQVQHAIQNHNILEEGRSSNK